MADNFSNDGSSTSNLSAEGSDSTVQINIKTLNSHIHSFQVDKNMPVSSFKEKIANEIGLPVNQQRLIFRGKVLKDEHLLSAYHVENGDTLHLVERQPAQSQSSGGSAGEASGTSGNRGNDANTGPPRNRIGQISHSVVLGTFNVGDQGEGIVPDLTRVIGAVLNSIGIGGQGPANLSASTQTSSTNVTGQTTQGIAAEGWNVGGLSQPANQAQSAQLFSSQTFQSLPQAVQIPLAAGALPIPSINMPIPDSLTTMSEFMNRMEQILSPDGSNSSSSNHSDSRRVNLPTNAQGIPTPEALSIILRQAEWLLSSHAVAALSNLSGRLERDGASSEPNIRGLIHAESMHTGLAMQHLGALLLELGRTILTLRLGQSPAELVVNPGPAVYISPSGPNPIMVQPFPLQTSSLFGSSVPPSSATFGPVASGSAPRNINIHIHAGPALAPVVSTIGPRPNSGEGNQGESSNDIGSGDSGSMRVMPVRNIIAATVPSPPTGVAATSASQSELVSEQQSGSDSLSSVLADINSRLRNCIGESQGDSVNQAGGAETKAQGPSGGSGSQSVSGSVQLNTMVQNGVQNSNMSLDGSTSENESGKEMTVSSSKDTSTISLGGPQSFPSGGITPMPGIAEEKEPSTNESAVPGNAIPLGLGAGGLERKRRGKQQTQNVKGGVSGASSDLLNKHTGMGVELQHMFRSLANSGSAMNQSSASETSAGPSTSSVGPVDISGVMLQSLANSGSAMNQSSARETSAGPSTSSVGPADVSGVMSQVLGSPSLNGLLSGVSEQTGIGSPDVLRNMLQQFTQNPQMMNTVNQVFQQVGGQALENMVAGMEGTGGGGIDLSRMLQQMMPIVSRALSGASTQSHVYSAAETEPLLSSSFHSHGRDVISDVQNIQTNLQPVAQRIERLDPPGDIFHTLVEIAIQLSDNGDGSNNRLDELCSDDLLAREYVEKLRQDLGKRFHGDPEADQS